MYIILKERSLLSGFFCVSIFVFSYPDIKLRTLCYVSKNWLTALQHIFII